MKPRVGRLSGRPTRVGGSSSRLRQRSGLSPERPRSRRPAFEFDRTTEQPALADVTRLPHHYLRHQRVRCLLSCRACERSSSFSSTICLASSSASSWSGDDVRRRLRNQPRNRFSTDGSYCGPVALQRTATCLKQTQCLAYDRRMVPGRYFPRQVGGRARTAG